MDSRWQHPFTAMICGPSGKTSFVKKFLNYIDVMCDTHFERILFYYSEWQSGYSDYGKSIEFREGLPQPGDYSSDNDRPKLVIIDDLMRESSNNTIVDLFTKGSHHKNLSVIFISQNLFHQGHGQRDISLNTSYIVVFKNPRDRAQFQHLARQIYPENPRFLQEAYQDATSKPHGYLLLDLKQSTPDNCRFRTNIFPADGFSYVYTPVKNIKGSVRVDEVPVVRL